MIATETLEGITCCFDKHSFIECSSAFPAALLMVYMAPKAQLLIHCYFIDRK